MVNFLNTSVEKLPIQYRLLLAGMAILSGLLLFYVLLLGPQAVRLGELRAQYNIETRRVQVIEAFALANPEADKYLAELDQRVAQVNKMLPNDLDMSECLRQIEMAAKTGGVQLLQVKPSLAVNKKGYREAPVEIIIKGTFWETLKFLKTLEDGPRFNSVTSLAVHSDQGMLECKLVVAIYSYGEASVNAAPNKTQPQINLKK